MPTISTLTVDVVANTSRLRVGLAAAGTALAVLGGAAVFAFKQFEDSEKVLAQTDAVLKSTGGAANVSAKQINDLANALSKQVGIDDEAIQSGENMILTFRNIRNEVGKGNDIFTQTTQAVTDISVAMGQDMKSSAIQVGKALNDPINGLTSLKRVGVQFTEEQTHMIEQMVNHNNLLGAQKIILGELTAEFGGSAAAQATASGKMKVALDNLAETVGGLLAPALTALLKALQEAVVFLQANVGPALRATVEWFQKLWDRISPVVMTVAGPFINALKSLWQSLQPTISALQKLWETFGPILKIVAAVGIAFVLLQVLVIGVILMVLAKVVEFAAKVISALASVAEWLKDKFVGAWRAIAGPVLAVIGAITNAILTLIHAVQTAVEWISKLGSTNPAPLTASGAPAIVPHGRPPGAAEGGFVAQTGLAVIHQGESIVPAGMGGITININGDVTGEEVVRKVRDGLLKLKARNATTGL
jgi:phage-related protein